MLGKNKKKPLKIVSEEAGGEAVRDLLKFVDEVDAEINLEDPRDYLVDPLREDFTFEQPYKDAKYKLVVPVDFSDKKFVPSETEHPHLRFVGRKIRRSFEVDDASKKRVSKSFTVEVLSYSPATPAALRPQTQGVISYSPETPAVFRESQDPFWNNDVVLPPGAGHKLASKMFTE